MPDHKVRTNPLLLLLTVLICLCLGIVFTRSSEDPSASASSPDMIVAENVSSISSISSNTAGSTTEADEPADEQETPAESTATPIPEATPTEVPEKETRTVSPEAERGVWTASGSNWLFMVDGAAYTGWLTDTDQKCYYFNSDGIMQTGWLNYEGNLYYLNLDGIMQTGDVVVDNQTYHLLSDGTLEGYQSTTESTAEPTAEPSPEPTEEPTEAADEGDSDAAAETSDKTENSDAAETAATDETAADDKTAETIVADKKIALTFDDGPGEYTDRILDLLEANNARATFFVVGQEISDYPDALIRMDSLGCELGNHSYTHIDFTLLNEVDMAAEIEGTDAEIYQLVGHNATLIRTPYGTTDDTIYATMNKPMVNWSIDSEDESSQDAAQIADTILSACQDGSIILLHDIYSATADAMETVIPQLIQQGYELVTVSELAEDKNIELTTGNLYSSMSD